jgi:molybdate transport system substrate-binding protein
MRLGGVVGAAALLLVAGCSTSASTSTSEATTLTVSAASSLTEALTSLAADFEADHPDVTVSLNFAGSSALAEQVNAGAPVDVLATASPATMAVVVDAGNAANPVTFARNELAVVVPAANQAHVTALADLGRPDVRTAVCAPDVPCGAATTTLLANNDLTVTPATLDPDVKSVLARVVADEVDAGVVYATDAQAAAADVRTVPIPSGTNVSTDYLAAVVTDAPEPGLAEEFVTFVSGETGRQTLTELGFLSP